MGLSVAALAAATMGAIAIGLQRTCGIARCQRIITVPAGAIVCGVPVALTVLGTLAAAVRWRLLLWVFTWMLLATCFLVFIATFGWYGGLVFVPAAGLEALAARSARTAPAPARMP